VSGTGINFYPAAKGHFARMPTVILLKLKGVFCHLIYYTMAVYWNELSAIRTRPSFYLISLGLVGVLGFFFFRHSHELFCEEWVTFLHSCFEREVSKKVHHPVAWTFLVLTFIQYILWKDDGSTLFGLINPRRLFEVCFSNLW
jgi:hypothetical protein